MKYMEKIEPYNVKQVTLRTIFHSSVNNQQNVRVMKPT
jgi:hypothetical protein